MTKKILSLTFIFSIFTFSASAYDSTGCGLGSLIFRGHRGPVPQILAITTNSATPVFGVTSNTSGCDRNGRITGGTNRLYAFLENNLDQFAIDAARGHGETLQTIAIIMNTTNEKVATVAQSNFSVLFDNKNVSPVTVTLKMAELLA